MADALIWDSLLEVDTHHNHQVLFGLLRVLLQLLGVGNGLLGVVDGAWARGQSLSEGKIDKGVPDHNEQTVIISLDDRFDLSSAVEHSLGTSERQRKSAVSEWLRTVDTASADRCFQ
jgi:hypothetical protein